MVPVEEWDKQTQGEEIELIEITQHIWSERIFVAKVIGIFVFLGLLIALLSPVEYETEAILLPESTSPQSGAAGLLQQYGGMLGMSGSFGIDEQGAISPQLYPQIVSSLPFQLELLNKRVEFTEYDTTVTVYKFFDEIHKPSVFSYISEYTIGLPGKVIGLFKATPSPEQTLPEGFVADSIISVSKSQLAVIKDIQDRLEVSLSGGTGVINLKVEMPDPRGAAEVGSTSITLLKEYITSYRTRKAREDLRHAQQQLDEVKKRFENVQNQLAEFRDSNQNLITAKAQTQEERLQSEYDLAFNVYNSVAQRVEQAKMKVQEQTPVVSILQPVQVPNNKSKPMRKLIVITSVFLGGFISVCYLVFGFLSRKINS